MRAIAVLVLLIFTGCGDAPVDGRSKSAPAEPSQPLTAGETRQHIAPTGGAGAIVRSGPLVPVRLPPGFTLYPGAKVTGNTVVEGAGKRRVLLVFETPDPLEKVMAFHRGQADAAGTTLTLDLGTPEQASIGGRLPSGGHLTISARQRPAGTRVEFSAN